MKKLGCFLLVYAAYLVQSIIIENVSLFSVTPNLLIAVVIIASVAISPAKAAVLGGFAGLLYDSMCGRLFGVHIIMYMYLALAVSCTAEKSFKNSPLLMGWIAFVYTVMFRLVVFTGLWLVGSARGFGAVGADIVVKGIFSAVVALIFVYFRECAFTKKQKAPQEGSDAA